MFGILLGIAEVAGGCLLIVSLIVNFALLVRIGVLQGRIRHLRGGGP